MSLFSRIGKVLGKVAKVAAPFIPGPIGAIARGIGTVGAMGAATAMAGPAMKALPAIGRSLPGIGRLGGAARTVGRVGGRVIGAAGVAATGVAIYDAAGNYLGQKKRSRRINPLNHRALKRAMSRIEKSKNLVKRLNSITIRKEKC